MRRVNGGELAFVALSITAITMGFAVSGFVKSSDNAAATNALVVAAKHASPLTARNVASDTYMSSTIELRLGFTGLGSCSGTIIRSDGLILSAAHCFIADECEFNGTMIPLDAEDYYATITNVNGTGEIWQFELELIGYSGFWDLALFRPKPLEIDRGGNITITSQNYRPWGNSASMKRGDRVTNFGWNLGGAVKETIEGATRNPGVDLQGKGIGAWGPELYMMELNLAGGSSGSASFDSRGRIVQAALSGFVSSGSWQSSFGTTQRLGEYFVNYVLNNPPTGPGPKQYLVPALGIAPTNSGPRSQRMPTDLGSHQVEGIEYWGFKDQDEYAWFSTVCGGTPPYTVPTNTIETAVLESVDYGLPPTTLPSFGYNIAVSMEVPFGSGNYVTLGSMPGQWAWSAAMVEAGAWVGDPMRMRFRETVFTAWQGVYNMTLMPVQPWMDVLFPDFGALSHTFLDKSDPDPDNWNYYADADMPKFERAMPRHTKMEKRIQPLPWDANTESMKHFDETRQEWKEEQRKKRKMIEAST